MKSNVFFKACILASTLLIGASQASDLPLSAVPSHVRQLVADTYPNATKAEWDYDKDDDYYEVDFKLNNQDVELKISPDGKLLWAKEDKTASEIPTAVKEAVLREYPNAQILGANRLIKKDGEWWDVGLKLENGHHRNVYCRPDGSELR